MLGSAGKGKKNEAMTQVRMVQKCLCRWDPIGVHPRVFVGPVDEYNSYAPHIVSMVVKGCSLDELSGHLQSLRTNVMGVPANPSWDQTIAADILATLSQVAMNGRGGAVISIPWSSSKSRVTLTHEPVLSDLGQQLKDAMSGGTRKRPDE
jgi:hypothetical protein